MSQEANMYDEPMGLNSGADKPLAKRIAEIKPTIALSTRVDSYGGDAGRGSDHMKERHARLKKEIEAIESYLADLDPDEALRQVQAVVNAELAHKRASLLECEAEMDLNDAQRGVTKGATKDGDEKKSGDVVAEGNPYEVARSGAGYVVRKKNGGKVKGHHMTKAAAMRQWRLLEGLVESEE